MKILTIGFTKKNAEFFFKSLIQSGVKRLIDVRLNNISQLAGFTKREDLRFFTEAICHIPYSHLPELAPTQSMLDDYKKHHGSWEAYEQRFLSLMRERHIEKSIPHELMDSACLLCSEEQPHHCHRRLVAEYLRKYWGDVEIEHLS